jgi:hypothetical protein
VDVVEEIIDNELKTSPCHFSQHVNISVETYNDDVIPNKTFFTDEAWFHENIIICEFTKQGNMKYRKSTLEI